MPELSAADLERYTQGRLHRDDDETKRILAEGLSTARGYCGWPVTPVQSSTLTLDGPGGRVLRLPTLRLVEVTSITEDGITIAPADLHISPKGMLRKKSGARWSCQFGAIEVTFEHGHAAAEDFDGAVLSYCDRASLAPVGGRPRVVGPMQYDNEPVVTGATFTSSERAKLAKHRLEPM